VQEEDKNTQIFNVKADAQLIESLRVQLDRTNEVLRRTQEEGLRLTAGLAARETELAKTIHGGRFIAQIMIKIFMSTDSKQVTLPKTICFYQSDGLDASDSTSDKQTTGQGQGQPSRMSQLQASETSNRRIIGQLNSQVFYMCHSSLTFLIHLTMPFCLIFVAL
jgi:hypothetical protein